MVKTIAAVGERDSAPSEFSYISPAADRARTALLMQEIKYGPKGAWCLNLAAPDESRINAWRRTGAERLPIFSSSFDEVTRCTLEPPNGGHADPALDVRVHCAQHAGSTAGA